MIRLLLTSGRGPAECRIALSKTLEALSQAATSSGLAVDVAFGPGGDKHGPGSAVAILSGSGAETFAASWTGSILWIATSPVRPHHKRKNWYIGISRLAPPPVAPATLDPADVRFEAFRAGGPGGQHQNKTESAVRAIHVTTGLAVVARDERSQHRNKSAALERLATLLTASRDLARAADRDAIQAGHDQLERGRPIRTFKGERFEPQ